MYNLSELIERIYPVGKVAALTLAVSVLTGGLEINANNQGQQSGPNTGITDVYNPIATPGETFTLQPPPSPTLEPTPTPTPTLEPTPTLAPTPEPTKPPTAKPKSRPVERPTTGPTFSYDLYKASGALWQSNDACTAATAQMTMNMGGGGSGWSRTTSSAEEKLILAYERAHMVTLLTSAGSDPAGERNAINHYGWGDTLVYKDEAYSSFAAASKAVVTAIARTHRPVVIFTEDGGHAQLITGYETTGSDPVSSNNFSIVGVYLTDPLRSDGYRNKFISLATWRSGVYSERFTRDFQTDAVYKDSDGIVGNAKWHGKWVIVAPTG